MQTTLIPERRQLAVEVLGVRYWQLVMNEELKQKQFKIPIHVAIGHEAIAVAVHTMMESDDQLVLTHRNMAYHLARAGALGPIYEEYKLLPTGVAGGRLGSMNLANLSRGVIYSSSILGNNISVACGLALGQQVVQRRGVVVVLTGDGGMEEGPFYEGLVFAESHRLQLLIVIENNNCSMSSTIQERRCPVDVASLCAAVRMPYRSLTSNDVFEYVETLRDLRSLVARGETPACLEVQLAALNQHAGPTPGWPTDPKHISLERGLVVEETPNDPVFVLQQRIGHELFASLSEHVLAAGAFRVVEGLEEGRE